jgi:hypothetical protein
MKSALDSDPEAAARHSPHRGLLRGDSQRRGGARDAGGG